MIVTHRMQPTDQSCGHTVLAMLTHIDPKHIVTVIGDRPTTPVELATYLNDRRFSVPTKLVRYSRARGLPRIAILRVLWPGTKRLGHWMLWANGRVYDPQSVNPDHWRQLGGRITSFLPVTLRA